MLVSKKNILDCLSQLKSAKTLFLDTETTGLQWHQGNAPFSIIISDETNEPWYFNLYDYGGTQEALTREELSLVPEIFQDTSRRVVAHNAKFDLHMMANIGINIKCETYDTEVMHRLLNNSLMSYTLASLTGEKDDAAKNWIKKNPSLGKIRDRFGELQPAYWKVPFDIMLKYATQDVVALRNLYKWQQEQLVVMYPDGMPLAYAIELKATRTIWKAERRGILVDTEYTLAARKKTLLEAEQARKQFKDFTGEEFLDSEKALDPIFKRFEVTLPHGKPSAKLKKTKPKTDEETLLKTKHPLAQMILNIRKPEKRISTYFDNYLNLRNQKTGAIHTDFRQSGADTMRMSASAPNVQNAPDESENEVQPEYPIRGCFVPRKGFKLVSIDFAAQEMRVIIDAAGEQDLANRIIGGEDVHQATADMMGVRRKPAKNIGFGIIYGSGAAKMASQIGCTVDEARRLRELYFSKLPRVRMLSRALMRMAEEFGHIVTRFGNRLFIDQGYSYKAVNYFVQGGSAIHTKNAANSVDDFLEDKKSKILLLIHDELLIEVHEDEMDLIPKIQRLMEQAFPHTILPQGTGVEIYKHRWGGEAM
jgi:DNA polymerase-1